MRAVSRKKVISPTPCGVSSTTCSAHGSWPLPVALGLYWPEAGAPRALQRAVDASDAHLEELGHLGGFPAHDLAEDERGPLLCRQVLERRDEREAHGLLCDRPILRIRIGGHERVGDRLDPGDFGESLEVRFDRLARGAEVHRARTVLLRAEDVEADIGRDAVEQRAYSGPCLV